MRFSRAAHVAAGRIEALEGELTLRAHARQHGLRAASCRYSTVYGERGHENLAVNIGTMERIPVRDAVAEVIRLAGYQPRIEFRPDMPTDPLERVADNALAKQLLGWKPRVRFMDGLRQTLEWYFGAKERSQVAETLERRLLAR